MRPCEFPRLLGLAALLLANSAGFLPAQQMPPPPAMGLVPGPDIAAPATDAAPAAPAAGAAGIPGSGVKLETEMTRTRDPFWPVGYVPPRQVATALTAAPAGSAKVEPAAESLAPTDWDSARKNLDIRGISLIGREKQSNAAKYLAVIGGRVVETGDAVSVVYMSRVYRWKVTAISPEGIGLTKLDARPQ